MSEVHMIPYQNEDNKNTTHSMKKEMVHSTDDISQWTVINEVSTTPMPCKWPDDKDSIYVGLHLIKKEINMKTSSNNAGDSRLNYNIKTEADSSTSDVSTEITDTNSFLININNENCDYTLIRNIQQGNDEETLCPVDSVKPEKCAVFIKQEPQSDLCVDIQCEDIKTSCPEEMTVCVVKEETEAPLLPVLSDNKESSSSFVNPTCNITSKQPSSAEKSSQSNGSAKRSKRKKSVTRERKSFSGKQRKPKGYVYQATLPVRDRARRTRCCLCKEIFKNKIMLNEHLRECHNSFEEQKSNFTSTNSSRSILSKYKRKQYTEEHNDSGDVIKPPLGKPVQTYECSKCDRVFVSKGNSVQHKQWHFRLGHSDVRMVIKGSEFEDNASPKKCMEHGSKNQARKQKIKISKKKPKINDMLVSCTVCNKELRKTSLLRHMKVHSSDPTDYPFQCPKCDKRYISKKDMLKHYARNHGQDDYCTISAHGRFPCSKCGKVYTTRTNLKLHHQSVHLQSFRCNKCDCTFYNNFNLQRHVRSCQKKVDGEASYDDVSFKCHNCEVLFTTKYSLTKHIARFHSDETPFKCEFCLKQFKTKSNLMSHVKRQHSTGKTMSVQCTKCSRYFSSEAELDVHCSVFRFVCHSCPQHFCRDSELRQHALKHDQQ